MTRQFFITGTGTDVGKTVVTRGIVRALAHRGVSVIALKPIESGVPLEGGEPKPHDGTALLAASRTARTLSQTCRYLFSAPVSPHLAARMENQTIHAQQVISFITAPENDCDVLIVEGAGGLLVPINDHTLYADVIAETGFELLIVAPNILGTINATLLTIEAAERRGIPVAGVILNQGTADQFQNEETIRAFGQVPILGTFPMVDALDDDVLADAAEQSLNLDELTK